MSDSASTKPNGQRRAELIRGVIGRDGAFGMLALDGAPVAVTCERTYPVAESAPDGPQFVKIPPGTYTCKRTIKHSSSTVGHPYECFEVTGVEGHSRLLFHAGNTEMDSEGCILLGWRFGTAAGRPAVLESGLAHSAWMRLLQGVDAFELTVRQP